MSIRIRTVGDVRVALCGYETDPADGDVYLDDGDHYALAAKFAKDWQGDVVNWGYPAEWSAMDSQKLRDAADRVDLSPLPACTPPYPSLAYCIYDTHAGHVVGVGLETDTMNRMSDERLAAINGLNYLERHEIELLNALNAERAKVEEMEQSFQLRWDADMRAIKRWQAATGQDDTWPDHADLCVWLLEQMDSLQAAPEGDELAKLEREIAEEGAIAALASELLHAFDDWLDTTAYDTFYPTAELRYLELRGLLEWHPERPELVRVKEDKAND